MTARTWSSDAGARFATGGAVTSARRLRQPTRAAWPRCSGLGMPRAYPPAPEPTRPPAASDHSATASPLPGSARSVQLRLHREQFLAHRVMDRGAGREVEAHRRGADRRDDVATPAVGADEVVEHPQRDLVRVPRADDPGRMLGGDR